MVRAALFAAAGAALAVPTAGCAAESDAETQEEVPEEQQEPSSGEVLRDERAPDGHALREVPADEAPSVSLEVEPDAHDGWNVHIDVEGFEFTPQASGESAQGGQGHAHLYVDDEKYRLYGTWFHLPYEAIGEGDSRLRRPTPIARAVERLMILDAVLARAIQHWRPPARSIQYVQA
jgi:hypothetical protein